MIYGRMRQTRLQTFLGCLTAILSLSVSSIAACACDHNGARSLKARPSCHAAVAHEKAAPVETPTDNDRLEKDCNCTIRISPASVLPRSESKTPASQQGHIGAHLAASSLVITLVQNTGQTVERTEPVNYETLARRRAPSRAPPRS
jgi:hypothetical protein